MGGASSNGGGGGDNKIYSTSREIGLMNQYKKPKQRAIDTQKMKNDAFREQGAYTTRRNLEKLPSLLPGAAILKALSEPLQRNSKRTRDFFTNKVLTDPRGKKNFGYTKDEFQKLSMSKQNEIYSNYITTRRDNQTDGYGTVVREGNDRNSDNQNKPILDNNANAGNNLTQPITPTNAEVTQASSTTMSADEILLANNKKGRKQTILNNPDGLGSSTTNTTKKTLGA